MKPPNLKSKPVFFAAIGVFACLFTPDLAGEEQELKGVVLKPGGSQPAPDSVVTIYSEDGKTKVAGPDTADPNGKYTFQVEKGESVVVRASWRSTESAPGTTTAKVSMDPTTADVRLNPPITAPVSTWYEAGRLSARENPKAVVDATAFLQQEEIPADKIFGFLTGARKESPGTFEGLAGIKILSLEESDPKAIAQGLLEADSQFKTKGLIPDYGKVTAKVDGPLTRQQYLEILGFIAPQKGDRTVPKWEAAVKKLVDSEAEKEKVDKTRDIFRATLFDTRFNEGSK